MPTANAPPQQVPWSCRHSPRDCAPASLANTGVNAATTKEGFRRRNHLQAVEYRIGSRRESKLPHSGLSSPWGFRARYKLGGSVSNDAIHQEQSIGAICRPRARPLGTGGKRSRARAV